MKKVQIFTDGACKGNPGPGGYGCLIRHNNIVKEFKGAEKNTTNNKMELKAAIVGLNQLKEPCEVELSTDSQYLKKGMTEWMEGWIRKHWKTSTGKPVKNKDLWVELRKLSQVHKITWIWVKGHNGHPENERCDALANEAMQTLR